MIHNDPEHLSKVVKQIFDDSDTLAVDFYDVAKACKDTDDRQGFNKHISKYLNSYLNRSDDQLLKRIANISFSYSFVNKLAGLYWEEITI